MIPQAKTRRHLKSTTVSQEKHHTELFDGDSIRSRTLRMDRLRIKNQIDIILKNISKETIRRHKKNQGEILDKKNIIVEIKYVIDGINCRTDNFRTNRE